MTRAKNKLLIDLKAGLGHYQATTFKQWLCSGQIGSEIF